MTMMKRMLAGVAATAALATAAPAAAQYAYPGYGYNPYASQYGYSPYSYNMTQVATQRCTAAVQQRLSTRTGLSGVIASMLGVPQVQPRVLGVSRVDPRRNTIRVRGYASSGRYAYSPYGVGLYGSVGAAYQPDLSFRCDVDYRGFIRDIDIDRR